MAIDDTNTDSTYLKMVQDRNDKATFQRALDELGVKPEQEQSTLGKIGSFIGNTAYGIGAEMVPQAIAGKFDAVRNAAGAVADFADWYDKNFGTPGESKQQLDTAKALRKQTGMPDFSAKDILGIGDAPTTWVGNMSREVSRFTTGFGATSSALGGLGLSGFMASPIAAALPQFFTQDPNQLGLSNLLEKIPGIGPIFNELAVNPDDPAIYNRLRHVVEGTAIGAGAEAVTRSLKAAAHWVHARSAAKEISQATPEMLTAAQVQAKDAEAMVAAVDQGKTAGPAFSINVAPTTAEKATAKLAEVRADVGPTVPGQVTAEAIKRAATLDDISVNVNWKNIDNGNLRGVIGDVASAMKDRISVAKRGEISLQAQQQMADALGMTNEDLLARGIGKAFNSEEIIAGGKLLNSSQSELYRLAHVARLPQASAVDAYNVNEQLVTHMGLLEQFLGGAGETGRALGAMRVVQKSGALARAQFMKEWLDSNGGIEGAQKLSDMLVGLETAGVPPGGVNAALKRSVGQWTIDAFKEAYGLGFLWKPVTQVRNIIGNGALVVQHTADLNVASKFSAMLGHDAKDMVFPGEDMAYIQGALKSWRTALEKSGQYLMTGQGDAVSNPVTDLLGHSLKPSPWSAKSIATDLGGKTAAEAQQFSETSFGKVIDMIGHTVRLPGRFLGAGDAPFKVFGEAGYVEQMAYRQALSEGLTGEAFTNRVANLITNVPEHVSQAAVDHALYMTFQNKLSPWGQAVANLRTKVPPLWIALTYVKTPANIMAVTAEHSPLAPIVASWRADIAAGGARESLALAKMATGSAMMSLLFDWARNGHITGEAPKNPAEREAWLGSGRTPNSLHFGKLYMTISGLGQLAGALSFAGNAQNMAERKDLHPEAFDTFDQMIGTGSAIIAHSLTDQSYMQSFAKFADTVSSKEEGKWGTYMRDVAGSLTNLVPGVPTARSIGTLIDPQPRQVATMWDALIKGMAGLSDQLIPNRDVFGHEIKYTPPGFLGALYNYTIPFRLSWQNDHPAFNAMADLHTGITKPNWTSSFLGVPINFRKYPEVLDYWRRLAGNELKHNPETREPIGLEDFLNRVVKGEDRYSRDYESRSNLGEIGTDSGKAQFFKSWAAKYRHAAAEQIMSEASWRFPDFYADVVKGMAHEQTQRLPINYQERAPDVLVRKIQSIRQKQEPLPDRFGRPSVQPSGFSVPQ